MPPDLKGDMSRGWRIRRKDSRDCHCGSHETVVGNLFEPPPKEAVHELEIPNLVTFVIIRVVGLIYLASFAFKTSDIT